MNILYRVGTGLFVNITNACPCDCIFCIRKFSDGYGDADTLWLEREPTIDEIKAVFDKTKNRLNDRGINEFDEIKEIVFCGFGEPMTRAEDVITLAKYFKETGKHVRLNTNGLVRLIHPDFDISKLAALDSISVSLNADDSEEYNRVTRPRYENAYDEVLRFITDAKAYTKVSATAVAVLEQKRIENCRETVKNLGVPFRVR